MGIVFSSFVLLVQSYAEKNEKAVYMGVFLNCNGLCKSLYVKWLCFFRM